MTEAFDEDGLHVKCRLDHPDGYPVRFTLNERNESQLWEKATSEALRRGCVLPEDSKVMPIKMIPANWKLWRCENEAGNVLATVYAADEEGAGEELSITLAENGMIEPSEVSFTHIPDPLFDEPTKEKFMEELGSMEQVEKSLRGYSTLQVFAQILPEGRCGKLLTEISQHLDPEFNKYHGHAYAHAWYGIPLKIDSCQVRTAIILDSLLCFVFFAVIIALIGIVVMANVKAVRAPDVWATYAMLAADLVLIHIGLFIHQATKTSVTIASRFYEWYTSWMSKGFTFVSSLNTGGLFRPVHVSSKVTAYLDVVKDKVCTRYTITPEDEDESSK